MMSEIEDLKNHILAITQKINSFFNVVQGASVTNERFNELMNSIHNLGIERIEQNNMIFSSILPDFIRRLTELEDKERKDRLRNEYKLGDHFLVRIGKGKKSKKVLMKVCEDGLKGFVDDNYIDFWSNYVK